MLSLNSYGCARPAPSSNQTQHHHVVLPRLSLHGGGGGLLPTPPQQARAVNSLTKLEMMRANAHPLYRTTAGFDYGRYMDFKDVALSCPKHAKPAKFTKEFIAGTFTDSSLTSIDKSKQRAECWQRKVAERTEQMQIKYDELQHVLQAKKEVRRYVREQRRREMDEKHKAATIIQAKVRGFQVRKTLHRETIHRHTIAATKIQQVARSRAQVRRAQQLLQDMKRELLNVYAFKIQGMRRDYLLRADAKRQLEARRQQKLHDAEDLQKRALEVQEDAARDIQRVMRGHLARRMQRQFSTTSTLSDKDDLSAKEYYGGCGSKNRIARKTLASLRRSKRDKSMIRIPLGISTFKG